MAALPRSIVIFLAVAVAGLAVVPLVGDRFYVQLITQIMLLATFAVSLDLLVGYAGLVSNELSVRVGARLGVSEATVRRRASRCLRALAAAVGKDLGRAA